MKNPPGYIAQAGAKRAGGGKAESAHTPVCTISLTASVTGLRFITMDIRAGIYKPAINSDVSITKPKQERISMLTYWQNGEWHEPCYNNKESFNRKGSEMSEMSETEAKQRVYEYVILSKDGKSITAEGKVVAKTDANALLQIGAKHNYQDEDEEVHIRPF